jgi:hypothetical protein
MTRLQPPRFPSAQMHGDQERRGPCDFRILSIRGYSGASARFAHCLDVSRAHDAATPCRGWPLQQRHYGSRDSHSAVRRKPTGRTGTAVGRRSAKPSAGAGPRETPPGAILSNHGTRQTARHRWRSLRLHRRAQCRKAHVCAGGDAVNHDPGELWPRLPHGPTGPQPPARPSFIFSAS